MKDSSSSVQAIQMKKKKSKAQQISETIKYPKNKKTNHTQNFFKPFRFQLALGVVCCQVTGFGLHTINLFNRSFRFHRMKFESLSVNSA